MFTTHRKIIMTICIAAIDRGPDEKEITVFATDHMVSTEQL